MSKPYKMKRLGILNAQGYVWTPQSFDTEAEARDYMDNYSKQFRPPLDLSKHKVVPVMVTVRAIKAQGAQQ